MGLITDTLLITAVGLAAWLLSAVAPFRRFSAPPALAFDVFAAMCVLAFGALADRALAAPVLWATEGLDAWYDAIRDVPWWGVTAGYFVLADFLAYWSHRLLHTRWLWPTHAWHHSPTNLYWLSGLRGSPLHVLLLLAPYVLAFVLLPFPQASVVVTAVLVLEAANQHVIHSNIRLPCERYLERVLVTPRYHFVHHNVQRAVSDTNFGFVFSVWDRWFGTFTDPDTVPRDDELGLGYDIPQWRLVLGLPAARTARRRLSSETS